VLELLARRGSNLAARIVLELRTILSYPRLVPTFLQRDCNGEGTMRRLRQALRPGPTAHLRQRCQSAGRDMRHGRTPRLVELTRSARQEAAFGAQLLQAAGTDRFPHSSQQPHSERQVVLCNERDGEDFLRLEQVVQVGPAEALTDGALAS